MTQEKAGGASRVEDESGTKESRTQRVESAVVPRPVVDPELLAYHLLRPRDARPADIPLLGEAFRCWSQVWQSTFYELEKATYLPSDDFTRQDEIGALFHDWECIATTSYRWIDFANPIYHRDSYFAAWSEEALRSAGSYGTRICISSSFTIAEGWRRATGFPIKELLGALVVDRFLLSDAATLVGTMRNDRGMSRLTSRLGFRTIAADAIHHGVSVDLVAFHRGSSMRPPFDPEVEEMIRKSLALKGDRHEANT